MARSLSYISPYLWNWNIIDDQTSWVNFFLIFWFDLIFFQYYIYENKRVSLNSEYWLYIGNSFNWKYFKNTFKLNIYLPFILDKWPSGTSHTVNRFKRLVFCSKSNWCLQRHIIQITELGPKGLIFPLHPTCGLVCVGSHLLTSEVSK